MLSIDAQRSPALAAIKDVEVDALQRLRRDYPFFAKSSLKITTKAGGLIPFELNRAQRFFDEACDDQRRRTGMVRKIVVKGRRMGISTNVQGRFYHKLWKAKDPLRAYILTHEQKASDVLFGITKRFADNHEQGLASAPIDRDSAKELVFADSGASYGVATAGSKAVGRGDTIQLFHGSEVAYWPNAEVHVDGVIGAVGRTRGTEIILESTANGVGNLFHKMAMAALRGQSEYELIFLPWYWDDTCRLECPATFDPSPEWIEYARENSLEWDQLYWAYIENRTKANATGGTADKPCPSFMQEYPANVEEAFQTSGNSFIPANAVMRARRPERDVIGTGPVILGIDPSRSRDRVGVIDRCGRRAGQRVCARLDPGGSLVYLANQLAALIDKMQPDMVNIDVGGVGAGVYDVLVDYGYGDICNAVNFGSNPIGRGPTGDTMYFNRRAEMHDEMRAWFQGDMPVQIPDDDGLQNDLCAPEWGPGACRYNSNNELIIEEKDRIKERLGASPDLSDGLALTFAVPYARDMRSQNRPMVKRRKSRTTGY